MKFEIHNAPGFGAMLYIFPDGRSDRRKLDDLIQDLSLRGLNAGASKVNDKIEYITLPLERPD